jgi:hypothetical protein
VFLFFNCQTARRRRASAAFALRATACQVAPCSSRPQGKPFISVRLSRSERAERITKNRFHGRPLAKRASRTPFESQRHTGNGSAEASEDRVNRTGPRKQSFACVPHADGFIGVLDVPGFGAGAPAPRSCELSPGHALVPSALVAVVWSATFADLRAPFHAAKTTAARSVSVRDRDKIFLVG